MWQGRWCVDTTHKRGTPSQVSPICDAVRERGDEAVKEFTAKFDRVEMQSVVHKIEVRFACEFSSNGTYHVERVRVCEGGEGIEKSE
jgi:histidinol dehydrogenase